MAVGLDSFFCLLTLPSGQLNVQIALAQNRRLGYVQM